MKQFVKVYDCSITKILKKLDLLYLEIAKTVLRQNLSILFPEVYFVLKNIFPDF